MFSEMPGVAVLVSRCQRTVRDVLTVVCPVPAGNTVFDLLGGTGLLLIMSFDPLSIAWLSPCSWQFNSNYGLYLAFGPRSGDGDP